MDWTGPIVDNHLHLDLERGNGPAVVSDFVRSGGTHLLVVNKPSWWYGVDVREPADFKVGFEATVRTVRNVSELLPGRAWAVLGVHPALISRLLEAGMELATATQLMRDGIDVASELVRAGEALALKSGRPHYPVGDDVWTASNTVLRHAVRRAADLDCALQLHTESGESFEEIAEWARNEGFPPERVVKHYAEGPLAELTPSVISRPEALEATVQTETPFLMETDYLDDPDRPGAVLGTKTVPRRVSSLLASAGRPTIERAHVDTPRMVYDIDPRESLGD